jgi:hypothetical protein
MIIIRYPPTLRANGAVPGKCLLGKFSDLEVSQWYEAFVKQNLLNSSKLTYEPRLSVSSGFFKNEIVCPR